MAKVVSRGRSYPYKVLFDVPYDMKSRFIYFVCRKGDETMVKIGSTTDPLKRFSTLQTSSPELLEMIGLVVGSHAHERDIGLFLRDHKVRGEWFTVTPELKEFVDSLPSLGDYIASNTAPHMFHPAPEYMFRLYQIGYTMEEIASFFGRTRQNVHDRVRHLSDDRHPKFRDTIETPIADSYNQIVEQHPVLALAGGL